MWLNQGLCAFLIQCLFLVKTTTCASQYDFFLNYLKHIHNSQRSLPDLKFSNGTFVNIEDLAEVNLNLTEIIHYTEEEILSKSFYQMAKVPGYKIIHLEGIGETWNVDQLEKFTIIMNKCQTVHNILGFVIDLNATDFQSNSLPYLKVAVHDMKINLQKKKKHNQFVGFYIGDDDFNYVLTKSEMLLYLQCSNHMPPDLFMTRTTIKSVQQINEECKNFPTELQKLEINTSVLPYSPRPGRCDCIMTSLYCYSNPESNINWHTNMTIRDKVCQEIDCSSIENHADTGHYGIFGGCTEAQKNSIILNLYYTYHKMDPKYCDHNGLAQIRDSEPPASDFRDIIDVAGIKCGEEIPDDWSNYVVGVKKPQVKHNVSDSIDNVYEQEAIAFTNGVARCKNSINKLLATSIFIMSALYMFCAGGMRQIFITVYI